MENNLILLDTSILIDYYRKKDKSKSLLFKLSEKYSSFAVSAITHYEIYVGAHTEQIKFWDDLFSNFSIIPFDDLVSKTAISIQSNLKEKNKQIAMADLFIAATAVMHNALCATLNKKHFERITELILVDNAIFSTN